MPTCKNGSGSYTGKEKSPTGLGYCARHEKIGTTKRGRDKKMWVVKSVKLASGKRSRRWFKMLARVKKTKAKTTKRKWTTKRKRTTKRNKLRGGIITKEELIQLLPEMDDELLNTFKSTQEKLLKIDLNIREAIKNTLKRVRKKCEMSVTDFTRALKNDRRSLQRTEQYRQRAIELQHHLTEIDAEIENVKQNINTIKEFMQNKQDTN